MVKIGVSFISMEQAKKNLTAEIPDWDFEKTKNDARKIWNDALGRIRVEGGTQRQKTIFYTALYRVMLGSQSIDLTEQGGRYYSRFDKQVHEPAAITSTRSAPTGDRTTRSSRYAC